MLTLMTQIQPPSTDTSNGFIPGGTRGKGLLDVSSQLRDAGRETDSQGCAGPAGRIAYPGGRSRCIYVSNQEEGSWTAHPSVTQLPLIREAVGTDYPLLLTAASKW
ncbi:MAG: hypothetical protein Ct9H300mP28_37280 [Pseudomonadota bacterium]|nr:MAG: hypothetical protein Ct9H300mP28_37280 [Pseudomonadota bacterium]